jgi:CRP-like cAMP-binding protein
MSSVAVKFPLFELLPESERPEAVAKLKTLKFGAGEVIYERGGDCTDAFFIFEGLIKIDSCGSRGEMAFFHHRKPGSMIGYYAAITGKIQSVTATAVQSSVVGRMPSADFMALILSRPETSEYMLKMVTGLLRSETNRIRHLIMLEAHCRVAAELLELVEETGSTVVEVPERVELAARLGMTRETLARHLSALQKQGLIDIRKQRVYILDAVQLAGLLE